MLFSSDSEIWNRRCRYWCSIKNSP